MPWLWLNLKNSTIAGDLEAPFLITKFRFRVYLCHFLQTMTFCHINFVIGPIFQIAVGNFHKVIMPFQQQKKTVIPDHFGLQLTNIIGIFESMRFYSLFPPNLESLVNHLGVVVKAIEKCQKLPNSKSWIQLQSILHRYITDGQMSSLQTENIVFLP